MDKNYLYSVKQYWTNISYCKEMKKYKDIHKGECCFIIGTGSSLLPEDLDKLHDKHIICFGTNRIFEIYPMTKWRPTYYVNQDFPLIKKYVKEIKELKADHKFVPIEFKDTFSDLDNMSYFVLRHRDFYPDYADFSTNLDHYLAQGFTVTYGSIQFAYYMGFSKVYLLGIDHNYAISVDEKGKPIYQEGVQDYFKGSTASSKELNLPRVVESTMAYATARKFADEHHGFKIYNATRGGKLEAFERVEIDKILAE